MATNLHDILENFRWRMESLSPAYTAHGPTRFGRYDPMDGVTDNEGGLRQFWIRWVNSGPDIGATDLSQREAVHTIRVHVEYPVVLPIEELQKMCAQDRHDINELLRDPANWDGYDDNNSTTDIGLMWRKRLKPDVLDMDERNPAKPWRYSSEWACGIRESEI